jgi:hypothetical protein
MRRSLYTIWPRPTLSNNTDGEKNYRKPTGNSSFPAVPKCVTIVWHLIPSSSNQRWESILCRFYSSLRRRHARNRIDERTPLGLRDTHRLRSLIFNGAILQQRRGDRFRWIFSRTRHVILLHADLSLFYTYLYTCMAIPAPKFTV